MSLVVEALAASQPAIARLARRRDRALVASLPLRCRSSRCGAERQLVCRVAALKTYPHVGPRPRQPLDPRRGPSLPQTPRTNSQSLGVGPPVMKGGSRSPSQATIVVGPGHPQHRDQSGLHSAARARGRKLASIGRAMRGSRRRWLMETTSGRWSPGAPPCRMSQTAVTAVAKSRGDSSGPLSAREGPCHYPPRRHVPSRLTVSGWHHHCSVLIAEAALRDDVEVAGQGAHTTPL